MINIKSNPFVDEDIQVMTDGFRTWELHEKKPFYFGFFIPTG